MTTDARRGQYPNEQPGGRRGWEILERHHVQTLLGGTFFSSRFISYDPESGCMTAERHYTYDGASIPKWVQGIVSKTKKTRRAALPHDMSYQLGREDTWRGVKNARKRIDQQFKRDLKKAGVGWWKRNAMYAAVRVAGGSSFKK